MKKQIFEILSLETIVGGGQTMGALPDGKKCFVWGGLPGETVRVKLTKQKASYTEAVVVEVINEAPERIQPRDPGSYLSTSPWQIMDFASEQRHKADLIHEAFQLHHVALPSRTEVFTDGKQFAYRNKVEFSWYSEAQTKDANGAAEKNSERQLESKSLFGDTRATSSDTLDLAFYRRGSKGKIVVNGTNLARPEINELARAIRNLLRTKPVSARNLKTLLIRTDQQGGCVWQLYLKDEIDNLITPEEAAILPAQGGEIIYSNPKSPASVITKRLAAFDNTSLTDTILGTPFTYACEGFFQVNIPVYEQTLKDMREWVEASKETSDREDFAFPAKRGQERQLDQLAAERSERADGFRYVPTTLDLYSGVGTIGLTIGGDNVTLVEINEHAVREMRRNIAQLGKKAQAVLAPSEQALDYITSNKIIIVDPPRAGLHAKVIATLLQQQPPRIIYLSCNPVTQARDVALLLEKYRIVHARGYNFFPRTPHIESLVVLDLI